jgi:hypothetical protein
MRSESAMTTGDEYAANKFQFRARRSNTFLVYL